MLQRAIVLAAGVLTGVLLLTGAGSASPSGTGAPKTFPGISLDLSGGWPPGDKARRGQPMYYEFDIGNTRSKAVTQMTIDLKFPDQKVNNVKLLPPPHGIVLYKHFSGSGDNHLVWIVKPVPASNGWTVDVRAAVLRTASGHICNQYYLTIGGKRANYSDVWGPGTACAPVG